MNKQKGLAPLSIVLLIALAVGGYSLYSNYSNNRYKTITSPPESNNTPVATNSAASPTSTSSTEVVYTEATQSANWKTYADNRLSIRFKYPSGWEIKEVDGGVNLQLGWPHINETDSLLIRGIERNTNLVDYLSRGFSPNYTPTEKHHVKINGTEGTRWSLDEDNNDRYYALIFQRKEQFVIVVKYVSASSNPSVISSKLDQILSTFKFTP